MSQANGAFCFWSKVHSFWLAAALSRHQSSPQGAAPAEVTTTVQVDDSVVQTMDERMDNEGDEPATDETDGAELTANPIVGGDRRNRDESTLQ